MEKAMWIWTVVVSVLVIVLYALYSRYIGKREVTSNGLVNLLVVVSLIPAQGFDIPSRMIGEWLELRKIRTRKLRLLESFEKVFGFSPSVVASHQLGTLLINLKLEAFALMVHNAFLAQEQLRFRTKSETAMLSINDQVLSIKKDFWAAHHLAQKFGYPVNPRYADYLHSPV